MSMWEVDLTKQMVEILYGKETDGIALHNIFYFYFTSSGMIIYLLKSMDYAPEEHSQVSLFSAETLQYVCLLLLCHFPEIMYRYVFMKNT